MSKYKKAFENTEVELSEEEIAKLFESYDSLIKTKEELIEDKYIDLYLFYLQLKSEVIEKKDYIIIKKKIK